MSDQDYNDPGYEQPMPGERRSNVLGIVGFVLAFCISPVGLLVSLIALMKAPRGFAIAGVIIGLLGSAIWAVLIGLGVIFGPDAVKATQTAARYGMIDAEIANYQTTNGALPPDLASLGLDPSTGTDGWGNAFAYTLNADGSGWTLRSASFDGQLNTDDDLVFESGMSENQIQAMIQDVMETHYEERFSE